MVYPLRLNSKGYSKLAASLIQKIKKFARPGQATSGFLHNNLRPNRRGVCYFYMSDDPVFGEKNVSSGEDHETNEYGKLKRNEVFKP